MAATPHTPIRGHRHVPHHVVSPRAARLMTAPSDGVGVGLISTLSFRPTLHPPSRSLPAGEAFARAAHRWPPSGPTAEPYVAMVLIETFSDRRWRRKAAALAVMPVGGVGFAPVDGWLSSCYPFDCEGSHLDSYKVKERSS